MLNQSCDSKDGEQGADVRDIMEGESGSRDDSEVSDLVTGKL